MSGKFEVYKDKAGEFRFRLKAGNGEVILTGEGYAGKSGVTNGIKSVRENAVKPERFEKKETKAGKPFFVLKAGNSQVIGQSGMYSSASACDKGIASVAKNAPDATVDD
ncbi:MAG: YegP family protein, partial [Pseudomonadales bacterium]